MSKKYNTNGLSSNVELGDGGVRIKSNSGVLEARNNADGAFAIVRGADPVGDNDVIINKILQRGQGIAITTAGTTIVFATAMASTSYMVVFNCYTGTGDNITAKITNKTVNGFKITPAVNGSIDYVAILI
jgi:pyridoxal/pyridoxine/pyridoxamine kinase